MSLKLNSNSVASLRKIYLKMATLSVAIWTCRILSCSPLLDHLTLEHAHKWWVCNHSHRSLWQLLFTPKEQLIHISQKIDRAAAGYRGDLVIPGPASSRVQTSPVGSSPDPYTLLCHVGLPKDSILNLLCLTPWFQQPLTCLCISNHHYSSVISPALPMQGHKDTCATTSHHVLNQHSLSFSSLNLVPSLQERDRHSPRKHEPEIWAYT